MKKILLILAIFNFQFFNSASAQLMKGTFKYVGGEAPDFAVNYSPDNCLITAQYRDININADGSYTYDMDMKQQAGDFEMMAGSRISGVYLEKDKTLIVNVNIDSDDNVNIDFEGDNADVSRYCSKMYNAFDIMKYSDPDGDKGISNDQYRKMLDDNYAALLPELKTIKDAKLRQYFTDKTEYNYISMKMLLLGDRAYDEKVEVTTYPEYQELLKKIDPNSELALSTAAVFKWLFAQAPDAGSETDKKPDLSQQCIKMMDVIDEQITNADTKRILIGYIPSYFFTYGDHKTGKEEFWTRYKTFAKDYPELIKDYTEEYNKVVVDMTGQKIPDLSLTTPEGKTVMLSTILPKAKITYIDCWATWCGPCCKEIPHLEKLVEKMKDNKDVQFLSFSFDSNVNSWKAKLQKDNPQWAQYILDEKNNKCLSDALNITGIPRFIIVESDGKIINPDAKRPSDPELENDLK